MEKKGKKLSGLGSGVMLSLCFSFLLFVYAPFDLYLTNIDEFWIKVSGFGLPSAVLFSVCFLCCFFALVIARLINEKFYCVCLAIGSAATIFAYIQGNFLVKNLPGTDGSEIDWNGYPAERLKSVLAFVIPLCILLFVLIKSRKETFKKGIFIGSTCFLLLFAVTLTSLFLTTDTDKPDEIKASAKDQFLMSDDENFVVLIFDALDSKCFKEALEKDSEILEELDGFTFFDNTLAGYPYTSHAMPFMFSGKWYENQVPYMDYLSESMTKSPVFKALKAEEYDIGLYDSENFGFSLEQSKEIFDNYYKWQISYDSLEMYFLTAKMAGMKYAPWDLKRYCWNIFDYISFVQINDLGNKPFCWDNKIFYSEIKENNPIELSDNKCAKIYHLEGGHVPFYYDCDFNPVKEGTYEEKLDACVKLLKQYIRRLKESGVYDNTAILVLGDHGYAGNDLHDEENVIKRFSTGLMIKGRNENHEFSYSSAPISFGDLSDAYIGLLNGKKSDEVFKYSDGDSRTRRILLFQYTKEGYMKEYVTDGTADDYKSYVATGKIYDDSK